MCKRVGLTNPLKAKTVSAGIVYLSVPKSYVWLLIYLWLSVNRVRYVA